MTLKESITVVLKNNPDGIKARVIARTLGVTKKEVNSILYKGKGRDYYVDEHTHIWVIKGNVPKNCITQNYYKKSFGDLDLESLIASYGYTTSQKCELSDYQRQCILDKVIENNKWTPAKVISHLQWCIDNHPNTIYASNCKKWKKDCEYVQNRYIAHAVL